LAGVYEEKVLQALSLMRAAREWASALHAV
jgi:hypothetical protein